ncbi:MAG: hypothetical protein RL367_483 [Pseudomonadota bacterium]|jgi:uncharacterized protein YqjF (DUF2071 family)
MRIFLPLALLVASTSANAAERRCGWLQNPTPGNWWLIDRQGEWTITTQGNPEPPGMDTMPDMSTKGWVEINGHHGYGCACMTVTTNRKALRITRIITATPIPLKQCRADHRLPKP